MDKFVFVSDFDGTMTRHDFYKILIDRHLGHMGQELLARWRRGEMKDIDFLATVFQSVGRSESELLEDIQAIELDPHAPHFIERVLACGGDFIILSAGTGYYIEKVLELAGIKPPPIISNPGIYADKGIKIIPDHALPYFSSSYGINKAVVVQELKSKYHHVYYAGDSKPDLEAALLADVAFAKDRLRFLLEQRHHPYIPFEDFVQIEDYLIKNGVITSGEDTFSPYFDSEHPGSGQGKYIPDGRVHRPSRF